MNIEEILKIAIDSNKMGKWNDALARIIEPLKEEELELVAGGKEIQKPKK